MHLSQEAATPPPSRTSHHMDIKIQTFYKKNKVIQGSEQQHIFQVRISFHHEKQYVFIRSVENVILTWMASLVM